MIGSNTHVDAANTLPLMPVTPGQQMLQSPGVAGAITRNVQVLSPRDADLYRVAFAAQAKGDWATADEALKDVFDKCLVGHVLADRYERRPDTAMELHDWLVSYNYLPEAAAIYKKAAHMKRVKGVTFPRPRMSSRWSGGAIGGSSHGFIIETSLKKAGDRAFAARIERTLRSRDPLVAKAMLDTEEKKHRLPAEETADVQSRIALGLFYEGQTEGARTFAAEAARHKNALGLWVDGLAAWKQNDSATAAHAFTKLAGLSELSSWDRAAAAFWAYRAEERNGAERSARHWLEVAAQEPRSFYGILASELLGCGNGWSWNVPGLNAQNVQVLANEPAGWRALALVQIGQNALAESELRRLNPQGHRGLQEAMLALAEAAPMPSLAVQLGGMAVNDNGKPYDAALYPIPSWKPEDGFKVDRALVYALIRRESQFDPKAVSDRGACGLMQIMPATAHLISDKTVARHGCSGALMNPSFNIALGQKYVRRLADQPGIGDNLLLLLAAYNSGPGKSAHWAKDSKNDPLLFIESVPVRETRDYVQHVLIHYWTYRARLAEPQTSLMQLAHGQWPRVVLHDETPRTQSAENDLIPARGYEVASSDR